MSLYCKLPIIFMFLTIQCLAQSACQAKPGDDTVQIPLQGGPNSFEPKCQPARIRVNDRKPVTLQITGLSPLDLCSVSSKAPAITPVTNPIEAIIGNLGGLGGFSLGQTKLAVNSVPKLNSEQFESENFALETKAIPVAPPGETAEEKKAREKAAAEKAANDDAFTLFLSLKDKIRDTPATPGTPAKQGTASRVFAKQLYWMERYQEDLTTLTNYLAGDYRGELYVNFQPKRDLAVVKSHTVYPVDSPDLSALTVPPSEVDFAELQSLVDELSSLQGRLLDPCTKPGQVCKSDTLHLVIEFVDLAKANLSIAQDNFKTLQATQAVITASYNSAVKAYNDYLNRKDKKVIVIDDERRIVVQKIKLGPDYGATDTGVLTCMNDLAPTQPTTDAINYSVLYQNVPALTASVGLLTTFQSKQVIGTSPRANPDGTTTTYFAITDSGSAQVFPMAFINYRFLKPKLTTWWGQPESELAITNSVSAGIGVNPNSGTNQAEFFLGDAVGFNRIYLHVGVHLGRTESLGGGFKIGQPVPPDFSGSAPIDWSYHPAFSIGFSVRIAPW